MSDQQAFWNTTHPRGVPTSIHVYNEGDPRKANAMASSEGWILFGYYFYNDHLKRHGRLGIDGTLAHEFAHRVQFTYNWQSASTMIEELEADAFAGYYMALRKGHMWSEIVRYAEHVFDGGDTDFNSPDHHGTPRQRLGAASYGVEVAIQGRKNAKGGYTAPELHSIFLRYIRNNLFLPR